jgi:hypothetical protein
MVIMKLRFGSCIHTAFRNCIIHADHPFPFSSRLCDTVWLHRLAYLAHIFTKVDELNLSFQGTAIITVSTREQIKSF